MSFSYLPYYPKYSYLDNIIKDSGKHKLNIYVDMKNAYSTIYSKWASEEIIQNTKRCRHIDLSLFTAFLEFISFHKQYAKKRNISINVCFFFDRGQSIYHQQINKDYKGNRGIADFFDLDRADSDLYWKVINKNWDLIYKVGNKIPGVSIIRIEYIESDFIPYYAIHRTLENSNDYAHVVYSNDKDMYQILTQPNIFQFIKKKTSKILTSKNTVEYLLKSDDDLPLDATWIPFLLAILGDDADGYKGVKGVGPKSIIKVIPNILEQFGNMNNIYNHVNKKEKLFNSEYRTNNKIMQKIVDQQDIVISNLKLASYELLSEFIDSNATVELIKMRKSIREYIENKTPKITNGQVLVESLEKIGISLPMNDEQIYSLFDGETMPCF